MIDSQIASVSITSVLGLIGLIFGGIIQYQIAKMQRTAQAIHVLVNSSMSAQLHVSMIALRRLAALPEATQDDIDAARLAEVAYREHEAKQKIVDEAR